MKKKSILTGLTVIGAAATAFGTYFSERVIHIKKKDEKEIVDRDTKLNHIHPVAF